MWGSLVEIVTTATDTHCTHTVGLTNPVAERTTTVSSCSVTTKCVLDLDTPCLLTRPCLIFAESREATPVLRSGGDVGACNAHMCFAVTIIIARS
jgi:hypothetical protein